jgi:hypothetical protein
MSSSSASDSKSSASNPAASVADDFQTVLADWRSTQKLDALVKLRIKANLFSTVEMYEFLSHLLRSHFLFRTFDNSELDQVLSVVVKGKLIFVNTVAKVAGTDFRFKDNSEVTRKYTQMKRIANVLGYTTVFRSGPLVDQIVERMGDGKITEDSLNALGMTEEEKKKMAEDAVAKEAEKAVAKEAEKAAKAAKKAVDEAAAATAATAERRSFASGLKKITAALQRDTQPSQVTFFNI